MMDTSTPVVVLKLEHYGGLGIVRSLGRLGIPVYGVEGHASAPGLVSRYCRGRFVWDVDTAAAEASVECLLIIGRTIGRRSILIPTSDETAMLVADYAEVLKDRFIFPAQDAALVHTLCSKKDMYFLAKWHGIPTAHTTFPQSRLDVERYLESAVFPVMLKGIDGRRLEERTGKKMVIVGTPEELLSRYEAMEDPDQPNLMLQEYIPGGDDTVWIFNGYFNERSECLLAFTGKKIRQNPVYTGMTSLGICLRHDEVAETTRWFMGMIGYRGILDIGYRYDARDGQYKVLDINPRIGATFRLFVAENGMDVARALYLDLTGQPVGPAPACEGRKWIVEDKDLHSCYRYFQDGHLTIGQWVRSLGGIREAAYFAADDPLPFLTMWTNHIRRHIARRNVGRIRPTEVSEPKTIHAGTHQITRAYS
jgi:predicted ATP-grasp superfamily ATP-dependent carboligase